MSDQVTRCPNCLVAFKVSPAQLQAANGLARCGACLTIFDARKQLTELPEALATREQTAAPDTAAENDFLIDDDFDPGNLDDNSVRSPDLATTDTSTQNTPEQENIPAAETPADTFALPPESLHLPVWLQDARQPLDTTREESPVAKEKDTPVEANAHTDGFESHSKLDSTPAYYADNADDEEESDPYAELGATATVQFDDDEIHGRRPEKTDRRVPPLLLKIGIPLIGALALLAQYIYFNVDLLGREVTQRPWLEKFCRVTGCDLPTLKDNSLIRSSDLVVRTHPSAAGALLVSAVLVNDAPFQQPFPTLQLVFQDLQGAVVAKRSFAPDEYVRGELTGAKRMPVRQPVRLELEILDPGETAVSFALYIL